MSAAQGMLTQLGIDSSNPVTARFDFQNANIGVDEQFLDANGMRGTFSHDISRNRASIRRVGGQLTLQPNQAEMALLLPWMFGASSGGTFSLSNTPPERYITADKIGKVMTYDGCKVDRWTMRASQGEALTVQLDVVGKDETVGNAGTFPALDINVATGPWMFHEASFVHAGTTYSMREVEFVSDMRIDKERFFNSQTLTAVNPTDRMVSLRTRLPYGDAVAAYNSGAAGVAVSVAFTNAVSGGVLTLSGPKVAFPRKPINIEGRTEIMLPLEGQAFKYGSTLELQAVIS